MNLPYRVLSTVVHRVPVPNRRWSAAMAGRRTASARWIAWAREADLPRRVVWMHAASVGEALAAEPVLQRLRAAAGPLAVMHTHTSPSVTTWHRPWNADRTDYAPEERRRALRATFDALRPSVLVFSRGDLWPGLVETASRRGIPVAVVGGAIRRGGARSRWPARLALKPTCRRVSYLGAVTETDAARWAAAGVPESAIDVTGDPRDDEILYHVPALAALGPVASWASGRPLLVAGSTHAEDDRVVLEAFRNVLRMAGRARLLVVPHDPGPDGARVAGEARRAGLECAVWTSGDIAGSPQVAVVNRSGLLAHAYALCAAAYVGGGLGARGVHSIAEAAAYAIPVVIGPRGSASTSVERFVAAGGVERLRGDKPAANLAARWGRWLTAPVEARRQGLAGRRVLRPGASRRAAEGILRCARW